MKWGTSEATGESIFKRLARSPKAGTNAAGGADGKIGAIVDWGAPEKNFGAMAKVCIGCEDDEEVVRGVRRAVNGDEDGKIVPGGGVDFTWARLRELESLRGWWNDNRKQVMANSSNGTSATDTAYPPTASLAATAARTVSHITAVYASLPPCTAFLVYSGTGDPREIARLQAMQQIFKKEFQTKKWDQLSVRWTDVEEQELKRACRQARAGCGFVAMK